MRRSLQLQLHAARRFWPRLRAQFLRTQYRTHYSWYRGWVDVDGRQYARYNELMRSLSTPACGGVHVALADVVLPLGWVAIVGSGYIGLEFSDVYTALGSEVTFIEALPNIMPGFDREIAETCEFFRNLEILEVQSSSFSNFIENRSKNNGR